MTAAASVDNVSPAPTTGMVSAPRRFDRGDLVYVAYLLLPLRVFLWLGRPLGWLEMLVRPAARRSVRANLGDAFGTTRSARELDRLTRQVFEYHQTRTLMLLVAPLMNARGQLEKYFPVRELQHLEAALASGRPVMLLGSHVNSVGGLLAVMQLRKAGYTVRCPMPDPRDAWAPTPFRAFVHRRLSAPAVCDSIGAFYAQFNVRPLVRELNQKSILLLMGDGWHSASFVDADFFGRRLPFTSGPLNLARAAGAIVVPIFSTGAPDRMTFVLEPGFTVDRTTNAADDVARAVRHYVGRVEQRALADVASWQHWMVDDLFETLENWRDRPLHERYAT